jgi:hypothetical protein
MKEDEKFNFSEFFNKLGRGEKVNERALNLAKQVIDVMTDEAGGEAAMKKVYARLLEHRVAGVAFAMIIDKAMQLVLAGELDPVDAGKNLAKLAMVDLSEEGIADLKERTEARERRLRAQGLEGEELIQVGMQEILAEAGIDPNDASLLDEILLDRMLRTKEDRPSAEDFRPRWEKI